VSALPASTQNLHSTGSWQMEIALVLRELWARKLLIVVGVLIAAVAAILSVYRVQGTTLKARSLQYSSASTQLLVDAPASVLGDLKAEFDPLDARALVYANFMASPAVLNIVGDQMGLQGDQIYAAGPVESLQPRTVQEPTALKRNVEITGEKIPYRLNFTDAPDLPTIGVNAQAPTTAQAIALANASVVGLQRYVTELQTTDKVPPASRVVIRQLGPASGGVVDGGISKSLAVLVFVGVLLLWCMLILLAGRFRDSWRASGVLQAGLAQEDRRAAAERAAAAAGEGDRTGDGRQDSDRYPGAHPAFTEHDETAVPSASAR
jgi:hypothetical protein